MCMLASVISDQAWSEHWFVNKVWVIGSVFSGGERDARLRLLVFESEETLLHIGPFKIKG